MTAFITTIDDIYDVYATLEELEVLTKLTKRWDAAELDQLPDYVKVCFTVFYNDINEVAKVAEREHGASILPYFQKVWTYLFEAYLLEAKWYHSGYKPSLKEYLENAWISITGPIILTHSYFLIATSFTDEALQSIRNYPKIVRLAATILRIADDMGTTYHELERGDNPKLVQCYMNDTGASEEAAREYVRHLLIENWKELNEERLAAESTFSNTDQSEIPPLLSKHGILYCLEVVKYYDDSSINTIDQELQLLLTQLNFKPGFVFKKDVCLTM